MIRRSGSVCDNSFQAALPSANSTKVIDAIGGGLSEAGGLLPARFTQPATNAIRKIANTCQANFKFAKRLMACSRSENYAPVLEPLLKGAAADISEPVLRIHFNPVENVQVKVASEDDVKKGYKVEDSRKESQVNDVPYAATEHSLTSVTDAGVYAVLLADGSTHEMLCGPEEHLDIFHECHSLNNRLSRLVVIDKDGDKSVSVDPKYKAVLGELKGDLKGDMGEASPSAGKAYRIFNTKKRSFSEPFFVSKVMAGSGSGLKQVQLQSAWSKDLGPLLFINPDYDSYDPHERVFGSCCRFVPVAFEKDKDDYVRFKEDIEFGDKYALDGFIFDDGYKKASVVDLPNQGYLVRSHHTEGYVGPMDKLDTIIFLMGECALKEAGAEECVKAAAEAPKRSYSFFYKPAANVKAAYNLRAPALPQFIDQANSEFGVNQQPNTRYILKSLSDKPYVPQHRIGDKYNPDPSESFDTFSPMQLYGLSQERGQDSLFEHGVVGSLTKTYDAISMVEKYLPDMECAGGYGLTAKQAEG